jgi:hypothetical protein
MTQVSGRILVWANRRGSALEVLAAVILLAGIASWLLGFRSSRVLTEAMGGAVLVLGVAALLHRTLGP